MALETEIQNLTAQVSRLADLLEDGVIPSFAKSKQESHGRSAQSGDLGFTGETSNIAAQASAPAQERKKPGPKPKPKADAAPQTQPMNAANPPANTAVFDEIVQVITDSADENGHIIEAVLKKHNAQRASHLAMAQHAPFLKDLKDALANNTAPAEESFV